MLSSVLLITTTDQLILMVQRRIADLWRQAAADVPATVNWACQCTKTLGERICLERAGAVPDAELRARLDLDHRNPETQTTEQGPPGREVD